MQPAVSAPAKPNPVAGASNTDLTLVILALIRAGGLVLAIRAARRALG